MRLGLQVVAWLAGRISFLLSTFYCSVCEDFSCQEKSSHTIASPDEKDLAFSAGSSIIHMGQLLVG